MRRFVLLTLSGTIFLLVPLLIFGANFCLADSTQSMDSHPGKILEWHEVEDFGCAICHVEDRAGITLPPVKPETELPKEGLIPPEYLQSTCIGCHETSFGLEGAEKLEAGRLAFDKYACYACHEAKGFDDPRRFGTPLEGLDEKILDRRWVISWLRNPQKLHPATIMPDFKLSDEEIRDITAFIFSLDTTIEYDKADLTSASADKGKTLFTEVGCKACHAEEKEGKLFRRRVPNLGDAGVKLKTDWVLAELVRPTDLNPDARIPTLDVTPEDTADIIAYLATVKENGEILDSEKVTLDNASLENGKELVESYACYTCHKMKGFEDKSAPGPSVEQTAKKNVKDFGFTDSAGQKTKWSRIHDAIASPRKHQGPENPLKAPIYELEQGEAENLTIFYINNYQLDLPDKYIVSASSDLKAEQAGDIILTERNCLGCHMFVEDVQPRIDEFIGLKTYVPPRLVGEGEKIQPEWGSEYLKKPEPMRPWLKMRMPNFALTEEHAQALIEYFSAVAASPEAARLPYSLPVDVKSIPQLEIDMGEYRFRFDKCMQCHPVSIGEGLPEDVELEDLSIDLMLSKKRLRFEWITNFLRDPDRYAGAGTKMPFIYYGPEGTPRISDPDMWIDYVTKFLMVMEEIPEPLKTEEKDAAEDDDFGFTDY